MSGSHAAISPAIGFGGMAPHVAHAADEERATLSLDTHRSGPPLPSCVAGPPREGHLTSRDVARTRRRLAAATRVQSRSISFARDWLFRRWYWYVNRIDKHGEVRFLNYGYADAEWPALDVADERDRYCIQLYRHVAEAVSLRDTDVVEIGCGRGGGLAWVTKTFAPARALGIDLEPGAVRFCNRTYHRPGLSFRQGDAQRLPLDDECCDAVLNVESSHRYTDLPAFLAEVRRILRPGGHLLLADYRYDYEMLEFRRHLAASGLTLVSVEDITAGVATALWRDDARRRRLVMRMIPRFARGLALNFAGAVGSPCYEKFAAHASIYLCCVLRKGDAGNARGTVTSATARAGCAR